MFKHQFDKDCTYVHIKNRILLQIDPKDVDVMVFVKYHRRWKLKEYITIPFLDRWKVIGDLVSMYEKELN